MREYTYASATGPMRAGSAMLSLLPTGSALLSDFRNSRKNAASSRATASKSIWTPSKGAAARTMSCTSRGATPYSGSRVKCMSDELESSATTRCSRGCAPFLTASVGRPMASVTLPFLLRLAPK